VTGRVCGVCGRCGRAVNLRGREGICSNCQFIANSAHCAVCGEFRRVAGRTPEGRPWCERCQHHARNRRVDEDRRRPIIGIVTAADPSLTADMVRTVLADSVTTRRSLRRLAEHLSRHPDAFSLGPTSVLPVLDRFTRALVAAGAQRIATIHSTCVSCGRRQPRHARTSDGAILCSACWSRTHKHDCSRCGRERRVAARDPEGKAICELCLLQIHRRERLDELNERIAAALTDTMDSLPRAEVIAAVERVAPTVPLRAVLAQQLRDEPALTVAARRHAVIARLLAELRDRRADLPTAVCAECDLPADPLFVHGGVVRCHACERRRDTCQRRGSDTDAAQLIIDAVVSANRSLSEEIVHRVLAEVVPARRHLPRLAGYVAAHPDVFTVGPTTTVAVVDRFTRALIAAGATTIRVIDPVCDHCGQRRPRTTRTPTGGLCLSCSRKGLCAVCGQVGRLTRDDSTGEVICRPCAYRRRVHRRHAELTERITTVVTDAQALLTRTVIVAALEAVAAHEIRRGLLAEQLGAGPALSVPADRDPLVARFLAELRVRGADIPPAACADCREPAEPLFIHRGVVRCHRCATHCPTCGHRRSRPAPGRCRWCITGPRRPTCVECGRAPRLGITDDGRCRQCRQKAEHHCNRCGRTSQLTRQDDGWICHRCALAADVDDRLGPADQMPEGLAPVRAAIAAADNPAIVRRWLRTSTGGQLLARLATGQIPLSHGALDQAGADRSIEYLRALLVAVGALPDEDRSLERLERFFDHYLTSRIADPADRKTVQAWLRWQVLPRLRKRTDAGKPVAHSANNARRTLSSVAELLDQFAGDGRNLHSAVQSDIDNWFAQPGAARWLARSFLAWARQRRHLDRRIQLPCPPKDRPSVIDDSGRWETARRLVNDDTLPADDRVAAALVVLYGQPLSRIARLTTIDIHTGPDGAVNLNLDGRHMPIHEPFATLIRQLPLRRTNGVNDQIPSPWLFPGRHAGKPVGPVVLGQRLSARGIRSRDMRNSARAQLVNEIPPAVLGHLIAISPTTASRWATLTNSNWNAYAGHGAREPGAANGDV
jgi:hypothetical protein